MRLRYLASIFVASVFLLPLLLGGVAQAQWSTDLNEPATGDYQEFYYWDSDNIVSVGGRYNGDDNTKITWYPKSGTSNVFNVNDDWIPVRPGTVVEEEPSHCTSLPATGNADGGIEIRLYDDSGESGGVLDVIGDGGSITDEDGLLKWGDHTGIVGQNRECNYHLYDGFNKNLTPYDHEYVVKGIPYAGHILGKKGMAFEEWTSRSDRRNVYAAYEKAAGNDIMKHCRDLDNTPDCINKLTASFEKCYAQAIGSSRSHVQDDNIDSDDWKNDLNATVLKDCMVNDESTDEFFDGDKGDFVQRLLENGNANIPPGIAPILPNSADADEGVTEKTTCAIAKIGWIMCPALEFFAKLNDQVFGIIQNWLYVNPFYADGGTNKTDASYQVWMQMRDVANVIFVLVFMVIVYSYLSNQGISQYSIKKMTPRLIITALLVNTSFYICALGVDISNVAGDSVYKIVHNVSQEVNTGISEFSNWETVTHGVVMVGGALAASIITIANLAALVPILVLAMLALVTTFVVLLLRQALIILLVVVSPIAFAMFLLPNTKKWFDRWRSTFVTLLLLYPAVALIFAGSYFASRIVTMNATENGQVLLAIFALGIQTIPLFMTPLLIKISGGVLSGFAGVINNPNKGPFDRLKNKANQFKDDRKQLQQTRAMNGAKGTFGIYGGIQRREARRKYRLQHHQGERDRAQAKMIGEEQNAKRVGNMAAGHTSGNEDLKRAVQDQIQEEARKLNESDTQVASVLIEKELFDNNSDDLMQDILHRAETGRDSAGNLLSEAERAAAIQKVVQNRDIDEIHRLVDNANEMSQHERETLADSIKSSGVGGRAAHLGTDEALESIRNGDSSVNNMFKNAAESGLYTPATMASQDHKTLSRMQQAHSEGALTPSQIQDMQNQFDDALNNPKISQHVSQASRDIGTNLASPTGGRKP